ncbi:MAG: efflux RND transporter periplasmic adaptor subunit [Betaproteobacteria bacterium]
MKLPVFNKPTKGQYQTIGIILLVASIIYSIYGSFDSDTYDRDTVVSQSSPREISPPQIQAENNNAEIRAQLQPLRYTTLSAEIPARIEKFKRREGDSFKKGEPLVMLDCVFQNSQLIKAKASKDATEKIYKAYKGLYELDAIGRIELENSFAESEKARSEYISIANTVEKCTIRAPFHGRIAEQKARDDQYVQPGQALLDILDASEMELEFLVPSKWLVWLNLGTPVSIHIDETNKDYLASIRSIGSKTDAVSQSIKVVAFIRSQNSELSPGMSGKINIEPPKVTP